MIGRLTFRYGIVVILILISAIASLSIGAVWINPIEAVKSLFAQDNFILNEYRIPRMILAIIVGSSLAISGALIQGVVRNAVSICAFIYFTVWIIRRCFMCKFDSDIVNSKI